MYAHLYSDKKCALMNSHDKLQELKTATENSH
jgi:hypothetical protein